ncbi:4Fe-4S dicluster domain-containing protein [Raoultibacter timonensis]|uniref:4Fe-4S ferredoxin n=1 Tax=Raoultibacter timonensis TaxID=1907662 RepID=A0ABM7WMG2_9ACTN|nr:4Fe-4S dicluster domain-containing protein [Raoultibacter timonensis]BDE97605.1 4Fe-4S ferredoxin [Raoultibacter timonensis]BDF52208.1 4Fe-4S ferredoxin [Raoultibacter timonensis]
MFSRKFVIADPGKCIGCKTCMAACLHRHDIEGDVALPRLQLVTTRTVSAPVGCHHCVDAPCVEACPTGCLYSDDERVGVRKEKCIGCRNCILACPYGAVDIVTEVLAAPEQSEGDGDKKPKRRRSRRKSTVIKCDLCEGHAQGSACVRACPTHALRLIDQRFLEKGAQSKRREAAKATAAYSTLHLNQDLGGR